MKSISEIDSLLGKFEEKYGLPVRFSDQGSEEWQKLKLGVISASNAHKVTAKRDSQTRTTYMAELVAQVCTGVFPEVSAKPLEWGNLHEDAARSSYEFSTGNTVKEVLFCFKDDLFRVGCSPDGLVEDKSLAVEIKCPFASENYIKFLTANKLKSEWDWQSQFQLWVMDCESIDFCQYDPRMRKTPLHVITVERDDKKFSRFNECVPEFVEDMDRMLSKIGVNFGDQWLPL